MRRLRLAATAVLVAGLIQAGFAQDPAPQEPPRPTFRTDINFVRVDVIVTEDGEPVTDLTQADFELLEDGRPVSIEQFRLIRVDGTPRPGDPPPRPIRSRDDEVTEAARDDTRVIAIFLDDYHTRLPNGMSVKRQLAEFLQTQLRPSDMVAVMYPLTPVSDVSFTRDHAAVIRAVNAFEGRKFRYQARNDFERQYEQQPTEVVENVRNQVSMSALRGLATRLGSVREGRKAVVYVSEGFTALLPPQLRSADASVPCLSPQQRGCGAVNSPGVGENNPREDTARWFASADIMARLQEVYNEFNRNNVSIYALDPRGLATGEFGIDENVGPSQDRMNLQLTQDTLRVLAEETDGKAITGRNDLAAGLQQMVRDSSAYYLIGYTSAAPTDGKFHEITINVRRRGVDVRGRRGFWAATAEDARRAEAATAAPAVSAAVSSALAAIATPVQSTRVIRTWMGTGRGVDGRTQVTLVWEPIPGPPGARREQPGRVTVTAATAAGDLLYRGPAASSVSFDAPPGAIEVRLAVEAAGGGVIDTDLRRLDVPDLTTPQAAVSTPRVYRARTARDVQAVIRDAAAVPTAGREFSRTERLLVRFDAYAAGTETPTVTAALLNRAGQKMADVPVAAAAAGGTHQIDLGLAAIAPAEYLLEITVKAGGEEKKELLAFRVGA